MRDGHGLIRGTIDPDLAADFPTLTLWSATFAVPPRGRREDLRARLDALDDRVRALATGALRSDSIAGAYRAFARQLGLDPDVDRLPIDALAVERLTRGRLESRGLVPDALRVAMLETAVPLWALDAAAADGPLRVALDDAGSASVSDDGGALMPLLGEPSGPQAVRDDSDHVIVLGLGVGAVAPATVEEAFWHVASCLRGTTR